MGSGMLAKAKSLHDQFKSRLVQLHNQLKSGKMTDEERAHLRASIATLKAKVAAETRRLLGETDSTDHAGNGIQAR